MTYIWANVTHLETAVWSSCNLSAWFNLLEQWIWVILHLDMVFLVAKTRVLFSFCLKVLFYFTCGIDNVTWWNFTSFVDDKALPLIVGLQGLLTEGFFWIPSLAGPTTIAARTSGSGISWLFPFVVRYFLIGMGTNGIPICGIVGFSPFWMLHFIMRGRSYLLSWVNHRTWSRLFGLSFLNLIVSTERWYVGWTGWCSSFGVGWHNLIPSIACTPHCFSIHLHAVDATTSGRSSWHILWMIFSYSFIICWW